MRRDGNRPRIGSLVVSLATCAMTLAVARADGPFGGDLDPFNKNNRLPGYIDLGHRDPSQYSRFNDPTPRPGPNPQQQQQQWQQQQWQQQQKQAQQQQQWQQQQKQAQQWQQQQAAQQKQWQQEQQQEQQWKQQRQAEQQQYAQWVAQQRQVQQQQGQQEQQIQAEQQAIQQQQIQQQQIQQQQQAQQQLQNEQMAMQQQQQAEQQLQGLPSVNDQYANNLGIYYQPVPLGNGAFGARLTRGPDPGSAAAQLNLAPGDVVLMLDSMPFYQPADVLAHSNVTTVLWINGGTNGQLSATVTLP